MTATAADDARGQLAEAAGCVRLAHEDAAWCEVHSGDWPCKGEALGLLVSELLKQAAADALREAADFHKQRMGTVGAFDIPLRPSDFAPWLRALAARLAPPTEPKEQQA